MANDVRMATYWRVETYSEDPEVASIEACTGILRQLDSDEARMRTLRYLTERQQADIAARQQP